MAPMPRYPRRVQAETIDGGVKHGFSIASIRANLQPMSKAFTKEIDEADEDDPPLPPATKGKNYITPAGFTRLQDEFKRLKFKERPDVTRTVQWAAENGDRSENADYTYGKKRLREIDRRLRFLSKRMDAAEVVDPLKVNSDSVMFGATVHVRYADDREATYAIVGVDEIDIEKGRISWVSPLAAALFRAKEGDIITFRSPKGPQEIEVLAITYQELP